MTEPTTGVAGMSVLALKAGGIKALAGAIAIGLMFAVSWPKTRREGVARIVCTLAGSMLGGKPLLAYVSAHFLWYPVEDGDMLVFVAAGLPAWWVLGGLARWLDKRRNKDIGQMLTDLTATLRKIRGG